MIIRVKLQFKINIMKVDKIETRFGIIDIEYSTFTKGFFIKELPEKFKEINGLKALTSRDNSFKEYSALESHVRELVHNASIDFEFSRKVIIYKIRSENGYDNSLSFKYLVCNESAKNQKYLGKENQLCEYFVIESNIEKYRNKRAIFGQITSDSSEDWVFIDYDEKTHLFIKNFSDRFSQLRLSLTDFFKEENIQQNLLNNSGIKLLN